MRLWPIRAVRADSEVYNMVQRVMVAVVCVPLLLLIFFWLPPVCLPVTFSLLSMVAVYEALWSTGFLRHVRICAYSALFAGLIPLWIYFGAPAEPFLCGLLCYVTLVFAEALASHYTVTLEKMGGAFFFALMIPYFLSSFIRISAIPELGRYYLLLPLVSAFLSDACALFAGMAFGKHKLAPELSPKKTVEGAVGGFLGAIFFCFVYGLALQRLFPLQVNYLCLIIYGALGSVISQVGDLSFSYIKRQYGLKDFGNILPGHGGVLDRFDSVIFCAPLTELLIWLLPALSLGAGA